MNEFGQMYLDDENVGSKTQISDTPLIACSFSRSSAVMPTVSRSGCWTQESELRQRVEWTANTSYFVERGLEMANHDEL